MPDPSASLILDLVHAFPGMRASTDEADRIAYARDLWPRHHMAVRAGRPADQRPGAIVWPTSTDEVARLVRWASSRGVALVPFGAGSGVCGGVSPRDDVLIVDVKRMGRIRALDASAPLVDVEAGHMGVPLETTLGRAGYTLGHFPSSILCSTVGGWVAARSAGQCSGAYGKIEDMTAALECVTGRGEVVTLRRRTSGPDLVPLVIGSEGTLAIVTSATLRIHPAPASRGFGAWSFRSTREGLDAMRTLFQAGLRPAVARLYDPFDAMLARQGGVKTAPRERPSKRARGPGLGGVALRAVLRRPEALNELLHSDIAARAMGGALLVVIFEGSDDHALDGIERARHLIEPAGGSWEGETPARRWLAHRYAVSYRQAPVFAQGAFVDTMEVATRWSRLAELYDGVRRALGRTVFVMAHFSHAYPDGCCIYFSFAGSADPKLVRELGWDAACEATYDRTWKTALAAAVEAGGTLSHHHGVGRSKAPRMFDELGAGVDVVRALMRSFDPAGILNPGNLVPPESSKAGAPGARDRWLDPVDQLLAGLDATLADGRALGVHPAPRRAVGPDLTALFVGAGERFGRIDRAWMRVHPLGVPRPSSSPFEHDRDPPLSAGERALLESVDLSPGARPSGGRP